MKKSWADDDDAYLVNVEYNANHAVITYLL